MPILWARETFCRKSLQEGFGEAGGVYTLQERGARPADTVGFHADAAGFYALPAGLGPPYMSRDPPAAAGAADVDVVVLAEVAHAGERIGVGTPWEATQRGGALR